MKKMLLSIGIVLLFLIVSFAHVNADQVSTTVDKDTQTPEPGSNPLWKSPVGMCHFNVYNGTKINYLFKIETENNLMLFGAKISGKWGGTSEITPPFKGQFDFTKGEDYEVRIGFLSLLFYPEDFKGRPYIIEDELGGTKLYGPGYGVRVYQ